MDMTPEEVMMKFIKNKMELEEFIKKEKIAFTSEVRNRLGKPNYDPWQDAYVYGMFEGWLLAMDKIRQENAKLKGD